MEGICRGCLIKSDEPTDLLQYTEKNRRLYVYCTGIQVKRNDAFTFLLCKGCYVNMKLACKFKKQCRNSDKRYKHYLHLKENGETTDFPTYLKNNEDTLSLRFPLLNGISYEPSVPRLKDDDAISTTTSFCNFVKEFLQPDEIAETEARIIREVIEEEADVCDDSLDSHWLQDDVSFDTEFRFSFSPFSTPNCTPKKDVNIYNVKVEKEEERTDEVVNSECFTAAKKILLKTTKLNEIRNIPEKLSPITDSAEVDDINSIYSDTKTDFHSSESTPMDIDDHTFIASKRILLNRKNNSQSYSYSKGAKIANFSVGKLHANEKNVVLCKGIQESDIHENNTIVVTEEGTHNRAETVVKLEITSNSFKKIIDYSENNYVDSKGKLLGKLLEYSKDDVELTAVEKDSIDRENQQIPLNAIIATPSISSIDKNLEKEPLESNEQIPSKPMIATPSIRSGLSGASALINDILFGKKSPLSGEISNPPKAGHTIKNYQNIEGSGIDILEDFFNKNTGEYVGEKEPFHEEIDELDLSESKIVNENNEPKEKENSNLPLLKPSKAKYDLSDMSCKLCNKKFGSAKGLRIHFCRVHKYRIETILVGEKTNESACHLCGKVFSRLRYVHKHLKTGVHQNTKVTCKFCSLEISEAKLVHHMKAHKNKTIETKSPKHIRKVRIEVCPICGFETKSSATLKVHLRRHNKETDYECSVCGRGFYRKGDFLVHQRTHNGIRPYSCQTCSKSFSRSDQLTRHTKTKHTGEKSYKCTWCAATFFSNTALKSHKNRTGKPCTMKTSAPNHVEETQFTVIEETGIVTNNSITGEIIETYDVIMELEDMGKNNEIESELNHERVEKTDYIIEKLIDKDDKQSSKGSAPLVTNEIGLHLLLDAEDGNND